MRVGMGPRVASSDHGDGGHAQCSPLPLFPYCSVADLRPSALARDDKGPGVRPGPALREEVGWPGLVFSASCSAPALPYALRRRASLCFSAHVSHRVWPGMASALQCRHKPSCLARCRFSCALLLPASWRSGRCCLRGGADGSVARFGRRWFAALAGSGASLGGTGGVVWRVGGSVERLFLSCSRRDIRCFSAQLSHLV